MIVKTQEALSLDPLPSEPLNIGSPLGLHARSLNVRYPFHIADQSFH